MKWQDRDPATRPSSMALRGMAPTRAEDRRAFWVDLAWWTFAPWVLVTLALLVVCALAGCSTTVKSQAEVIAEADVLLRAHDHPEKGMERWEARRQVFLEDAKPYIPKPSPSPSPTPAGGGR